MKWKLIAVCLLILTSGCVLPEGINASTTVGFSGDFESNESEFEMSGFVIQQKGSETLTDVSVCGYSEQGELLFAKSVPPFDRSTNVTIRNDATPKYVIIYSEEFWGSDKFWRFGDGAVDSVDYYEYYDDSFWIQRMVQYKSELPIDTNRPKQNGCPT